MLNTFLALTLMLKYRAIYKYSHNALLEQTVANGLDFVVPVITICDEDIQGVVKVLLGK